MRGVLRRCVVMPVAAVLAMAISEGPRPARADGEWTLLPEAQWTDEFSPMYTDGQGLFCEGDPTASEFDDPAIVSRVEADSETLATQDVAYVQNEALVNFTASTSASTINSLFDSLDLQVLGAWFEPDESDPDTSISWFHVGITSASAYHENVPGLVNYLNGLSSVESAGYNDCATLCTGGLYDELNGHPNDTSWAYAVNNSTATGAALYHLGLYQNAWPTSTSTIDFGSNVVAVAVMDTGIDVDHEDFLTDLTMGQDDEHTQIYTRVPTSTNATKDFVRHSLSTATTRCCHGEVPDWQALPNPGASQQNGQPASSASSVTKTLDLAREWHGHGTAMAGIISAAGDNSYGIVSCGTRNVRLLSARMRMVTHRTVELASAIKLTKKLRKFYGSTLGLNEENEEIVVQQTDVRVVYMGFATDLFERSVAYNQLLRGMRRDRRKGKNDRIWIAGAANNTKDSTLISYPAGILRNKVNGPGAATLVPDSTNHYPAMLGVTGVDFGNGVTVISPNTNTFTRADTQNPGNFVIDTGVYGISAYADWHTNTTDARDDWYGTATAYPNPAHGGARTVGYRPRTVPAGGTAYILQQASGGIADVFTYTPGTNPPRPNIYPGNSIAAAQVASLAGILMSKWAGTMTSGTEADRIVALIKSSTKSGVPTLGATTAARRVVGPVHFAVALSGTP